MLYKILSRKWKKESTEWEKIYAKHRTDKGLVWRIYENPLSGKGEG